MAVIPGDPREGLERLERKHAGNPEGRFFVPLADAYRRAGDPAGAVELLREGLQSHPEYLSAHIVLGRCYLDLDDPEAARAEFRYVLALDPQNLVALGTLGDLAAAQGRSAEAERWYQELLAVDPMNEEARTALHALAQTSPEDAAGQGIGGGDNGQSEGGAQPPLGAGKDDGSPARGELDPYAKDMVDLTDDDGMAGLGDEAVVTETIAALYTRQGFHDRAADVYRELIRRRGRDAHLEARLREAEHRAAGGEAWPEAPTAPERDPSQAERDASGVDASGMAVADPSPADSTASSDPDVPSIDAPSSDPFHPLIGPLDETVEADSEGAAAPQDEDVLPRAYDFSTSAAEEEIAPADELERPGDAFAGQDVGDSWLDALPEVELPQDRSVEGSAVEGWVEDPSAEERASSDASSGGLGEADESSSREVPSGGVQAEPSPEEPWRADEPSLGAAQADQTSPEEPLLEEEPWLTEPVVAPVSDEASESLPGSSDQVGEVSAPADGGESEPASEESGVGAADTAISGFDPFADSFAAGFGGVQARPFESVAEELAESTADVGAGPEVEQGADVSSEEAAVVPSHIATIGDFLRSVALWTRDTSAPSEEDRGDEGEGEVDFKSASPELPALEPGAADFGSAADPLRLAPPSTELPADGGLDGLDWIGSEFLVESPAPPAELSASAEPEIEPEIEPIGDPYADLGFDAALGHSPPAMTSEVPPEAPLSGTPEEELLQRTDDFDDLFPWEIPAQEEPTAAIGEPIGTDEGSPADELAGGAGEVDERAQSASPVPEDGQSPPLPSLEEAEAELDGQTFDSLDELQPTSDVDGIRDDADSSTSTTAHDDDDLESFQAWLRSLKR